jgi:hypothetical protein
MNKPVLYLDVVGTLMVERGKSLALAPEARAFVDAAKQRFELRFLTTLEECHAVAVARALEADIRYTHFRHNIGKAAAIDYSTNFWWVDDDPTAADLLRLSDERRSDRLMAVDRRRGVTLALWRKIESALDGADANERSADT